MVPFMNFSGTIYLISMNKLEAFENTPLAESLFKLTIIKQINFPRLLLLQSGRLNVWFSRIPLVDSQ